MDCRSWHAALDPDCLSENFTLMRHRRWKPKTAIAELSAQT